MDELMQEAIEYAKNKIKDFAEVEDNKFEKEITIINCHEDDILLYCADYLAFEDDDLRNSIIDAIEPKVSKIYSDIRSEIFAEYWG